MADRTHAPYAQDYDLTNCEAEPVHLIRHYQMPASCLLLKSDNHTVVAHSSNFPANEKGGQLLGRSLTDILPASDASRIERILKDKDPYAYNPQSLLLGPELIPVNLVISINGDYTLLEFEPRDEEVSSFQYLNRMDEAIRQIQTGGDVAELYDRITKQVKDLTGFDRVMLYRFDEDHNGQVISEAREKELVPFLGLHYPSTDFPLQARKLLLRQRSPIRHIIDTNPADVNPIIALPGLGEVDLSYAANRGTSPIHLRYMQNMQVGASMAMGLVVDGKLWGLVACHHQVPKLLDYRVRSLIGMLGRVVSGHLSANLTTGYRERELGSRLTQSRLFEAMNANYNIVQGLTETVSPGLLELTEATGAFILLDDKINPIGDCPTEDEMKTIINFLNSQKDDLYTSACFFDDLPQARNFTHAPAGILSISLGQDSGEYLVWMRPEIRQTVSWGGRPEHRKQVTNGQVQLHPEISFAKWEQEVDGKAQNWEPYQIDAAYNLRDNIREVIMLKYQEIRRLNGQLTEAYQELETFSYTVSHDLRAPLRNIKGFVEIIQEDYSEELDDYGRGALDTIVSSVGKMNNFINDILSYSKLGRADSVFGDVSLRRVVAEIWSDYEATAKNVDFNQDLAVDMLTGDYVQLTRLFQNLISNAIKYSSNQEKSAVSVKSYQEDNRVVVEVADNGIGLDMKYADRIFSVFDRLVSEDDYEGTGVGLAVAKRIVDKHNGHISVSSAPGEGTTFTVALPLTQAPNELKSNDA